MSDSKAKQDLLKKLQIAADYKKLHSTLAKENDKVGEFKLNQKDQAEISKIKKQING